MSLAGTHAAQAGALAELHRREQASQGRLTLRAVADDAIAIGPAGDHLESADATGATAAVTTFDMLQSNGITRVTDFGLSPRRWSS